MNRKTLIVALVALGAVGGCTYRLLAMLAVSTVLTFHTPAAHAAGPSIPVTPHRFGHPTLKYLGSAAPIPDAHAKCLMPVEEQHSRRFQRYQTMKVDEGMQGLSEMMRIDSNTDWGVPPRAALLRLRDHFQKKIREQLIDLEEARRNLAEEEEELRKALRERETTPAPLVELANTIVVHQRETVGISREAVLFDEDVLDDYETKLKYVNCALMNDLPPTTK